MKLLLVEDDELIRDSLSLALTRKGYVIDQAVNGLEATSAVRVNQYDLILLDLGLPGLDGLEVLKEIRKGSTPVIIITARDTVDDRIRGLDLGANDYLVKPFHVGELEARIRAAARKSFWQNKTELTYGSLTFDTNLKSLKIEDKPVELTPREVGILETLLKNANKTVSKRQLIESTSGVDGETSENAIEIMIHRLRKKLDPANISITTIRGFGYCLKY